jgi:hypothetical protein
MPGLKRAEDAMSPSEKEGVEEETEAGNESTLQVQGSKMKLAERTDDRDTSYYCVVSTAPAEKQWCVSEYCLTSHRAAAVAVATISSIRVVYLAAAAAAAAHVCWPSMLTWFAG